MLTSPEISELATACAKAQLDLKPAVKDALNPAFRSKYADLAAIVEAAKVFARNGVAIFQELTSTDAGVAVTTRLVHGSGQFIEFAAFQVPLAKKDAHGVGSAATYAKRYAMSAALAISADEDDDANEAAGVTTMPKKVATPPPGVEDWILDLQAVAAEGTAALKASWAKSPDASREYLMTSNMPKWEAIKKIAVDADAKARKKDKVPA